MIVILKILLISILFCGCSLKPVYINRYDNIRDYEVKYSYEGIWIPIKWALDDLKYTVINKYKKDKMIITKEILIEDYTSENKLDKFLNKICYIDKMPYETWEALKYQISIKVLHSNLKANTIEIRIETKIEAYNHITKWNKYPSRGYLENRIIEHVKKYFI
jgi:hypothetical protein